MSTKKPTSLDAAFAGVNQELLELFLQKHHDYGKGNILANKELGIAMRISEKVERMKHLLISAQNPENESIEDTWKDIAVYAIIAVLFTRKAFQDLDVDPEVMKKVLKD